MSSVASRSNQEFQLRMRVLKRLKKHETPLMIALAEGVTCVEVRGIARSFGIDIWWL